MFFTKLESRMKHRIYLMTALLFAFFMAVVPATTNAAGTAVLDQAFMRQVEQVNDLIRRVEALQTSADATVTSLGGANTNAQAQLGAFTREVSELRRAKEELERYVETMESNDIPRLQRNLSNINSQISTQVQTAIDNATRTIESARDTLTTQIQVAQTDLTNIKNTTIAQLQQDVRQLQQHELAQLRQNLATINDEILQMQQAYNGNVTQSETRINGLVGAAQGAAASATQTANQAADLVAQAQNIKTEIEESEERITEEIQRKKDDLDATGRTMTAELRTEGARQTQAMQTLIDTADQKFSEERLAKAVELGVTQVADKMLEANKDLIKGKQELQKERFEHDKKMKQEEERLNRLAHEQAKESQKIDLDAKKEWWENTWPKIQSGLGTAFSQSMDFISDKGKMTRLGIGVGAIAACVLTAKYGTNIAAEVARKYIMTPNLVTDTSIRPFWYRTLFGNQELTADFDELILAPQIKAQVMNVANGARAITHNKDQFANVNYQNVCFYGPPGTGKTMAAKLLAGYADMDYAYINGGDVAKLPKDEAILQLERLFKWAKNAPRGLLLFVDEAEAFLCNRQGASENLRLMINAFIAQCGTSSKEFMIVTATNHADSLDTAVRSRIEHFIPFEYPGEKEREQLITQYLTKFSLGEDDSSSAYLDQQLDIALAVQKTKDFAGRDIEKMANDIIVQAHLNHNSVVSNSLLQTVVDTWVNMLPIKRKMEGQGGHLANAHAQHVPQQHGHQQLVPAV